MLGSCELVYDMSNMSFVSFIYNGKFGEICAYQYVVQDCCNEPVIWYKNCGYQKLRPPAIYLYNTSFHRQELSDLPGHRGCVYYSSKQFYSTLPNVLCVTILDEQKMDLAAKVVIGKKNSYHS